MSTILDARAQRDEVALGNWRLASADMNADSVFRSAIEANFAPLFEKLESAINNEELLESMLAKCKVPAARVDLIRNLQGRIDVQI
jgi:hypothetical protein